MKKTLTIGLALAVILALVLSTVALADNVVNNVTIGGTDTFTAPGSTTVGYKINQAAAGDPQSGCNASDGSPATVTLNVPAGVTASTTSLTFTACNVFQNVTFSSSTPSDYAINVSSISDSGTGSYKNEANFTLHVLSGQATDTTPPDTTITDNPALLTNSTSANFSFTGTDDVTLPGSLTFECQLDDGGFGACTSPQSYTGLGEGSHTFQVRAKDAANNVDATPASYTWVIDITPPTVGATPDRSADHNGWYNHALTVSFSAPDAASCDAPVAYSGPDSAGASVTGTCTDAAGNVGSGTFSFKYDATRPSAGLKATGTAGTNGWFIDDVTITTSGTDAVSSIEGCTAPQYQTTETTGATFNGSCTNGAGLTTDADALTVKLDKTGPSANLAVTAGTPGAHGWYTSDVTVSTSGTDSISGPVSCTADQHQTTETTGATFNGSCTNDAGLVTNADALTVKLDKTGPSASLAVTAGTAGANGWYTSDVTVSTSGSDSISSPVSCTADQFLTGDSSGTTFNGLCTNDAGLTTNATALTVKLDKTPPTASASASPDANSYGWNNTDVTVTFSGTDNLSGVASCSPDVVLSNEGADQPATGTCTDKAGNVSVEATVKVSIDKTKPALNITVDTGANMDLCSDGLPSRPSFAPTDSLSGIASKNDSWTTPSTPSGVGKYTYSATATDKAGNTESKTLEFTVSYGSAFSGYLQPINTDGSSRFKLGSTIPVKFRLMCGTTPIANATAWMYVAKGDSVADPGVDEATSTAAATTGNLFRYDSSAQQYIFNLSTKLGYTNPGGTTVSFSTGTWTLKILLDDGTWHSINIQLPK